MSNRPPRQAAIVGAAALLTACASPSLRPASDIPCDAADAAYQVTDDFMTTFNSKDASAWGSVFHFPHTRIASGQTAILRSPEDLENSFARLAESGWDRSAWAKRRIVQCGPDKVHMTTTFVRYRADGSEMSRFDSLYIIERRNGRWGLSARSSFAP
jgi:hypothetical protein